MTSGSLHPFRSFSGAEIRLQVFCEPKIEPLLPHALETKKECPSYMYPQGLIHEVDSQEAEIHGCLTVRERDGRTTRCPEEIIGIIRSRREVTDKSEKLDSPFIANIIANTSLESPALHRFSDEESELLFPIARFAQSWACALWCTHAFVMI